MIRPLRRYAAYCLAALCLPLQAEPVVVQDFLGREVRLATPAKRIVALAPHIVENVYSAGAGEQLVGVVAYSNYPEQALALPQVGGYRSFSLEALLALEPDLVLMWASGNGAATLSQIEALGLPVYVDELSKLEDIAKSLVDIGRLSGHADTATAEANAFLQRLARLSSQYRQQQPVSMLYQVWNEPLQTLNGDHIINDVIELCGGRNVFADALALAPKIGLESVFERDPQAIVASGMDEARPEWLDEWLQWPRLQAVSGNNLYFVPPDLLQRHTVRLLDGAEILCQSLAQARAKQTLLNHQ